MKRHGVDPNGPHLTACGELVAIVTARPLEVAVAPAGFLQYMVYDQPGEAGRDLCRRCVLHYLGHVARWLGSVAKDSDDAMYLRQRLGVDVALSVRE